MRIFPLVLVTLAAATATACGSDDNGSGSAQLSVAPATGSTGGGTVSGAPGLNCQVNGTTSSGTCSVDLGVGVSTTLSADPDAGSLFGGWAGACTGTGTCAVTMSGDRSVQVTFVAQRSLTVTMAAGANGSGIITSTPAGINCTVTAGTTAGECSADFASGTAVSLSASPAENALFNGWGGACTGATCEITVTGPTGVIAHLVSDFPLVVEPIAGNQGSGVITSEPAGITCTISGTTTAGACSSRFNGAEQVTLTATPSTSSWFVGWTGGGCAASASCIVPLDEAQTVEAQFDPLVQLALSPTSVSVGSAVITSDPAGMNCTVTAATSSGTCTAGYPSGTDVTLTATPASGSHVFQWSACAGTGTCTVQVTTPRTLTVELQQSRALAFQVAGQFAQVPDAGVLDLGTDWTIEAWIRPQAQSTDFQHVISKWGLGAQASYSVEIRDLRLRVAIRHDGSNVELESEPTLVLGTWQHVAATLSGGMLRLFINGQQVAEAASGAPDNAATPLTFGREAATGNLPYPGALDEVRIWSFAKSALELQVGMNKVAITPAAGLIGYWRFDEPSGQVINDLSVSGNDGTLGSSTSPGSDDAVRITSDAPIN